MPEKKSETHDPQAPKIVVDARMVGEIGHGVARYVQLMGEGLRRLDRETPLPYRLAFLTRPGIAIAGFESIETEVSFLHPREQWEIPRDLREAGASLYHSPSFASLAYSPCPWIVTVHDLIHLEYGNLAQKAYYATLLKRFVRKARAVATVSEFSRREISRWAGIPVSGIEVVHNAIEPESRESEDALSEEIVAKTLARFKLASGKYFLCLSSSKPHKNVPRLIEAYAQMRSTDWPLAVTTKDIPAGRGVRKVGALDENEAKALLQGAGALVYPSLLEGFGRPPLEAALQGVPVIVSRIPVHIEALSDLAPDEALWVDPEDTRAWAAALLAVQHGKLRAPGLETRKRIAERYSIRGMGEHMDRIYRRVLGSER